MDWNQVEGNWKQVRGNVKKQWGKLTDDDLTAINFATTFRALPRPFLASPISSSDARKIRR